MVGFKGSCFWQLQELLSAELPEDLLNDSCNGSLNSHQNENQLQSCSNSQSSSNTGNNEHFIKPMHFCYRISSTWSLCSIRP